MLRTETIAKGLKEIAKGEAQRTYFFERASAEWLAALAENGYFLKPPSPVSNGQYLSFPVWAESRYLARIAKIKEVQPRVLEVACKIPETENTLVHQDLLDVAIALPSAAATQFAERAIQWVKSPHKFGMQHRVRDFILHLTNGGHEHAALEVTRAALALQRVPFLEERGDDDLYAPETQAQFSGHDYSAIAESVTSPLAKAAGTRAVALFADLLDDAISLGLEQGQESDEDYLYIWYQNLDSEPRHNKFDCELLAATRRVAEEAVRADSGTFGTILHELKGRRWVSFRRLALHLCAVFPELSRSESAEQLTDIGVLSRSSTQLEAKILLRATFGRLPEETQVAIFRWIEQGPNQDFAKNFLGLSAETSELDDYCNRWRRDQLALAAGQLPAVWEERLREYIAALGPPNPLLPAVRFSGKLVKPAPAIDRAEALLLSPETIIKHVQAAMRETGSSGSASEGMSEVVRQTVANRPGEFCRAAMLFQVVDPIYLEAYFRGLHAAQEDGVNLTWSPLLSLAGWVAGQLQTAHEKHCEPAGSISGWVCTRRAILDLLKLSLRDGKCCLGLEHQGAVLSVLRLLTSDPDPTPQQEAEFGDALDPPAMAINTVRGEAFSCLVVFALWLQRGAEQDPVGARQATKSFEAMPEVRDVLEAHLNVMVEPSLTIRSLYGRWLPSLGELDAEWTISSLPLIFPGDPSENHRLLAAWESFVVFASPSLTLFSALVPYYRDAIERIPVDSAKASNRRSPEEGLAEHVALYYWHGRLELHESGGLLPCFLISAPPKLRGYFIRFLGCAVSGFDGDLPDGVRGRLCALLEERLGMAGAADLPLSYAPELSEFGLWFKSRKFDDEWSLHQLQKVLDLAGDIDFETHVTERLADLAPKFPRECVTALKTMIERATEAWLIMAIRGDAIKILRCARDSGDPDAAFDATTLAQSLIGRQFYEFRELV